MCIDLPFKLFNWKYFNISYVKYLRPFLYLNINVIRHIIFLWLIFQIRNVGWLNGGEKMNVS